MHPSAFWLTGLLTVGSPPRSRHLRRFRSSPEISLREAIKVRAECDAYGRSDVLACSVDTPIIIEDSASKTESEDELPPVEGLLLERKVATPVAEAVNTGASIL